MTFLNDGTIFKYSPDFEFYQCSLINWKERLHGINIDLPLNIIDIDFQLCQESLSGSNSYISGPFFPFLLYINDFFYNHYFIKIIYFILFFLYIYLSYKITNLKDKKSKILLLLLLTVCPTLLWVSFYPSTDLVNAVFWLTGLYIFKKYIYRVNKLVEKKNKPINTFNYLLPFSIVLTFCLLTRPSTSLILCTILAWIFFDILYLSKIKKYKYQRFLSIVFNSCFLIFICKLHLILYSEYGIEKDITDIIFHAWSPPSPDGIIKASHISIKTFLANLKNFPENPLLVIYSFLKLILLSITYSIFGLLTLSGIQITSIPDFQSYPSFKNIAALLKAAYGFIIILPGIHIIFLNSLKNIFLFLVVTKNKIKRLDQILYSLDYFKFSLFIIVIINILFSLFLIPHVRYLTPILPFILSTFISEIYYLKIKNL